MDHALRPRPAGGIRPEFCRDQDRRARGCEAAGAGRVRRFHHQPPEAPDPGIRRPGSGAQVSGHKAGLSLAARHGAPGDLRSVHERPGPDQQQGPAVAGDGGRAAGDPGGAGRAGEDDRPRLPGARRLPDGRCRRRHGAAQLGRRDGQGDGRRIARERQEGRRALAQRAAPVPRGGIPPGAAAGEGRDDWRSRGLLRRRRRQPVARGARRDPDRPAEQHPGPVAHLWPGRKRLLCRRRRAVLRAGDCRGGFGARRRALRLPRRHGRQAGQQGAARTAADPRRGRAGHGAGAPRRSDRPAQGRTRALVENDRSAQPHRAGTWRVPGLRRVPDAAPDL